jgi:Sulfotransferase family
VGSEPVIELEQHTFVFIGGLHRSGTTLLARCLAEHPEVSGFSGTRAREDEGQHLQTVYKAGRAHGGPGRFGFDPDAHLTERSELVSDRSRSLLLEQWGSHWDASRPVLVEKSPPNLIRTRFLQALFPDARFVALLRHPVAVAGATRQFGHARRLWRRMSYSSLIEHWLHCHELLFEDAAHIRNLLVMRYEEFVANPDERLADVYRFVGIEPRGSGLEVRREINDAYFSRWALARRGPKTSADIANAIRTMEERVNRFGYSLEQPVLLTPLRKVG